MMNQSPADRIRFFKAWLKDDVFPLWTKNGIDTNTGGFHEALDFSGQAQTVPRRCLVQSRQVYSYFTGARMNVVSQEVADQAIINGAQYMLKTYMQQDGSFIFSVHPDGSPKGNYKPLYTQAFALFGLAQAFAITSRPEFKTAALKNLNYLRSERQNSNGGFTEVDEAGTITYASNPHMHLFEAALAWVAVDEDPQWKHLAIEISQLAQARFVCPEQKVLAEFFDSQWRPLRSDGKFIYEPGHQYEWAWLFKLCDELCETQTYALRHQLFELAEKYGVSESRKVAYDEMWSDYTVKAATARFWPQGERIKAAARLASEAPAEKQPLYTQAADEAMDTLFKYLQTPLKGLWYDQMSADDKFAGSSAKASSLYHIINAMEEYELYRLSK